MSKIVLLGMMSRWPVAGVAWVTVQYLEGLRRLGHDVYYVEAHGCTQTKFMRTPEDDGVALAADYIASVMRRFDFNHKWAYHDVHLTGRCYGMSREQLDALYGSAALLINLHGATEPLPEHTAGNRLVYLETDPVEVQIALGEGSKGVTGFLAAHCAWFTWGLNYGNADCRLPTDPRFPFKHSPPVVVTDFWQPNATGPSDTFTTIGNWRQGYKQVVLDGETYHWSKHLEFLKFLDLPRLAAEGGAGHKFELALSPASFDAADAKLLADHGWAVRDGLSVSTDLDTYHRYVSGSRGEFTVAKDQNVRLRSGWFSERSAQYLAAGRPVITQETGFGNVLPTGQGLFGFSTMEDVLGALEAIHANYPKHSQAATEVARECLDAVKVLGQLLEEVGVSPVPRAAPLPGAAKPAPPPGAGSGPAAEPGEARDSLQLRDSYTREYYLEDCGGFDAFKKNSGKRLEDGRLQAVAMLTGLKPAGRALDLGCGRGEITYYLARRGFEVTAVDYSASALQLAEQCFIGEDQLRARVRFVCDSVCTAPLEGRYDLAVAADVVEHLSDAELDCLYARTARHLGGGGVFVVHTFPNRWFYQYEYARRRRVAASVGAYLPPEPRSPYERLMHINEQSPPRLRRHLGRHFRHVLLWFCEPADPGGSLLKKFDRAALRSARDLFAVASDFPIDVERVRACLCSKPLPPPAAKDLALTVTEHPRKVPAGGTFAVTVDVANATPHLLKSLPPNPVYISYHWLDAEATTPVVWDGERSILMPPCANHGTYEARVLAPPDAGVFTLRAALVQEGVWWFDTGSARQGSDVRIEVYAEAADAPVAAPESPPSRPLASPAPPLEGVNVAGYLRTESGVGSAVRGYVRALKSLGVPLALRDLSGLSGNRAHDDTHADFTAGLPYDVNLVCIDLEPHFAALAELGEPFFSGRYNIGIWWWELPRFPEKWHDRFAWYDEVWVGTSFIANALAPVSPVPVLRVPPVVAAVHGSRPQGRRRLGASEDEFIFLFVFDFNSHVDRKNPLGAVEAFRLAFGPRERARLVLKCVNADSDRDAYERLQERAAGCRIDILTGYWTGREVRDLTSACDAYVSLHRSEGMGLTIAEAMSLGKPVIATGWSGNMDFMTVSNSYPVRFELVEIEKTVGPYRKGETWAEPSVEHAAAMMRRAFDRRDESAALGARAARDMAPYGEEAVAVLIKSRLKAIAERRNWPAARARLREPYFVYRRLLGRVREAVASLAPGAVIAVASRGDEELVRFEGRTGWHFPQTADGVYAGHHPPDDASAVEQLESLRHRGARFFLLPSTMAWWLAHYVTLAAALAHQHRRVHADDACEVYELRPPVGIVG